MRILRLRIPGILDAPSLLALPAETVTYAEVLRDAGYACGFFGKWHLSLQKPNSGGRVEDPNTLPDNQGFMNNVGGAGNGGPPSWFSPYKNPYIENGPEGEYLPYRLADEAIAFMRANKDKSFLINFWPFLVHSPLKTTEALAEKYQAKRQAGAKMATPVYTGMIDATDQVIGRLLDTLDELGLRDNTLVVLCSDNGGIKGLTNPAPAPGRAPANVSGSDAKAERLRMGKGYLFDGGLRIPMIVRWPGKIAPGAVNDERVTQLDYFPTFLEAAGARVDPKHTLDGESLVPLLTGEGGLDREAVYFHYPNYAWHGKNRLGSAIIQGDYKLYRWYDEGSVELYNVRTDPGETQDLTAEQSELAAGSSASLSTGRKRRRSTCLSQTRLMLRPKGAAID